MTYRVRLTRQAQADLQRLFDFIIERELASHTGDLEIAEAVPTQRLTAVALVLALIITVVVGATLTNIVIVLEVSS